MIEPLSTILLANGLMSEKDLAEAAHVHESDSESPRFDRFLVSQGFVSDAQLTDVLADLCGMERGNLQEVEVDSALVESIPLRLIYKYQIFPVSEDAGCVQVAVSDPWDLTGVDELRIVLGRDVDPILAPVSEIGQLIKKHFGVGGETLGQMVNSDDGEDQSLDGFDEEDLAEEASVVRLVNEILNEAIRDRASDIHIEHEEHGLSIRSRIDGVLREQALPPGIGKFRNAIVSRLKIMAKLNIAEKRVPQDGRIRMRVDGREVDIRVSIIPMIHGEGVVMRILDRSRAVFSLQDIGLDDYNYGRFGTLIDQPHGIILVTGPTGSGKSTTLYSALCEIKDEETKIITVEDPVEYQIKGISQIQVQHKVGLNFARALRSILRHDPDVVLVGEIRDLETAEIAMEAAMTGHLVFSTLHTNDAASSFARLTDMGIEPFLVASTIEGVLAQRLVRRVCPHCVAQYEPIELPPDFPIDGFDGTLMKGLGCRECRGSGYSGRTGIHELLVPSAQTRQLVMQKASSSEIQSDAAQNGMRSLRHSGYQKVLAGITTLDEVARVSKAGPQSQLEREPTSDESKLKLLKLQRTTDSTELASLTSTRNLNYSRPPGR